jgi:hypothetical protein
MRAFARADGGSLSVLTVVLMPLVLTTLVGALELGFVRVVAERSRIAADLATLTAVNDQDDTELARSGRLIVPADAVTTARQHLALDLEPLSAALAASPAEVADAADVTLFSSGNEVDPRTGRPYGAPTVRLAVDLPIRTPAFAVLLARPVTVIRILSASSAR